MIFRIALIMLLIIVPLQGDSASPVKARTLSGIGVVKIPALRATESVVLYQEPGVGQLRTLSPMSLPLLKLNGGSLDRLYLPVMAKKRGWLKVVFDDAERTGWLEMRRDWEYGSWAVFLENRQITMLKGLRKDYYLLRKGATVSAAPLGTVDQSTQLVCRDIDGDWAFMEHSSGVAGWLRWRDENGRLLFLVYPPPVLH